MERPPPALLGALIGAFAVVACGRIGFDRTTGGDAAREDGPAADASGAGCPQNYQAIGGLPHRYRAVGSSDYNAGVAICLADGVVPAVVDDAAEAAALNTQMAFGSAWAGVVGAPGGQWVTALGAAATYLPWGPNEPLVSGPGVCVEVYPTDLSFRTQSNCAYQWFMFCECVP